MMLVLQRMRDRRVEARYDVHAMCRDDVTLTPNSQDWWVKARGVMHTIWQRLRSLDQRTRDWWAEARLAMHAMCRNDVIPTLSSQDWVVKARGVTHAICWAGLLLHLNFYLITSLLLIYSAVCDSNSRLIPQATSHWTKCVGYIAC